MFNEHDYAIYKMDGYEGPEVSNLDGGTDRHNNSYLDTRTFLDTYHYGINSQSWKYGMNLHDVSNFHKRN
jgi:hypothetical protein